MNLPAMESWYRWMSRQKDSFDADVPAATMAQLNGTTHIIKLGSLQTQGALDDKASVASFYYLAEPEKAKTLAV